MHALQPCAGSFSEQAFGLASAPSLEACRIIDPGVNLQINATAGDPLCVPNCLGLPA